MKSRIAITVIAVLFLRNIAWSQSSEVVLPESVKAAADINNTNPATVEQFTDPIENFKDAKNDYNMFNSSASVGAAILTSKYLSIYNVPFSYSLKAKLLFRNNADAYENLSFKAVIPIAKKKFETLNTTGQNTEYKTTGLGDAMLKANYTLILQNTFFSFSVLAKLPTAKKSNTVKDRDVPLGTGSTDIDLSLYCSKTFENKITARASFGYDYRTTMDQNNMTYDYGNRLKAMIGGDIFLKNMNAGVDFNFASIANNKMSVTGFNWETPGITTIDAMPFVKFNLPYSVTATINAIIPVVSKWKSVSYPVPDPDRKIKIGVSLSYRFTKSEAAQ